MRLSDARQSSDKLYLSCRIEYKTDTCEFKQVLMNLIYGIQRDRTCIITDRTSGEVSASQCGVTNFKHKAKLIFSPKTDNQKVADD